MASTMIAFLAIYNYLYSPPQLPEVDRQQEDMVIKKLIVTRPPIHQASQQVTQAQQKLEPSSQAKTFANSTFKNKLRRVKPRGMNARSNIFAVGSSGIEDLEGLARNSSGQQGGSKGQSRNTLGNMLETGSSEHSADKIQRTDSPVGDGRSQGHSGYGNKAFGEKRGAYKITQSRSEESYSGTIDREAIRQVIQSNLRVVKACYERQLNRSPDLFGKLVIEWDIGADGAVARAGVRTTELSDAEVGNCVVRNLKTWKFPVPPTGSKVNVSFPFYFSN